MEKQKDSAKHARQANLKIVRKDAVGAVVTDEQIAQVNATAAAAAKALIGGDKSKSAKKPQAPKAEKQPKAPKPKSTITKAGHARVTEEMAKQVAAAMQAEGADINAVAKAHGITPRRVKSISSGRTWKAVTGLTQAVKSVRAPKASKTPKVEKVALVAE